jgi:hypothetical protein
MFSAHTNKLRREIDGLLRVIAKHEQIRSIVWSASPPDGMPADVLELIKRDAPEAIVWKIYDHSASYTRLYALFENFVFGVIEEWLSLLPSLFEHYHQLPEQVKTCHRVGVGQILMKLGGDQYQHLSEESVLKGIAGGVVEEGPYSFLPDAFYTEGQNLWPGVLASLFKKVGIDNALGWINRHRDILNFLRDFRGNASSAESELKSLVQYRNLAAHGDIVEVVSAEDFSKVAKFVIALSNCLAELIMWNFVRRREATGFVEPIGEVIRNFSENIVGISASGSELKVEDTIVVISDSACHYAVVKSIQENHVPFSNLMTRPGQQIAAKLTHTARDGSQLLRLSDNPRVNFLGESI